MKTIKELENIGYKLEAVSANAISLVYSYIAIVKGKKIYGFWSYKLNKYIEENC
jgi:hypothetical protein